MDAVGLLTAANHTRARSRPGFSSPADGTAAKGNFTTRRLFGGLCTPLTIVEQAQYNVCIEIALTFDTSAQEIKHHRNSNRDPPTAAIDTAERSIVTVCDWGSVGTKVRNVRPINKQCVSVSPSSNRTQSDALHPPPFPVFGCVLPPCPKQQRPYRPTTCLSR